ncbi:competence protein ComEA [Paenibacillus catalpae]|uniref:Competence protein ComEA n=1 Tax=Paenibacillus catalpae TaxID=1045775 RepID=A0A1I2F2J5_9BACL|nr:ComEA family DNA-binding protein [Paenibacillus catalpae]SFE99572.1 competence protein ComEA [Paenibacillus catalpae]
MARLLYGRRTNTNGSRRIVPLFLIAAAAVLLITALAQPKEKAPDDWVQLNREVSSALQVQEAAAEQAAAVPEEAEAAKPEHTAKTEAATPAGKLDVNRATAEQLDTLKGIGPAKAQAIIADREQNGLFQSVDDLLRVKGIGSKLLAGIKDSIVAMP